MRTLTKRAAQACVAIGMLAAGLTIAQETANTKPSAPASAPATAAAPAGGAIGWRGDGSGIFDVKNPPLQWDEDAKKGIVWTAKVGKSQYGSPIVVAGKVLLLREPDMLVCLDAETGKQLWEKPNNFEQLPAKVEAREPHADTGNTTPTPVSDGKHVWIVMGTGIVACYDMAGNRKWIVDVPDRVPTEHGRCASPVLVGDKLIVSLGVIRALDAATGKELWKCEDVAESYGCVVPGKAGGQDVVVDPTGHAISVKDGQIVAKGMGQVMHTTPVWRDGVIYWVDPESAAYVLEGADKIKPRKLWSTEIDGEYFASPVVHDGLVYAASDKGTLYCLDAKTKDEVWKQMLDIASASGMPGLPSGHLYPSLAIAGGLLYVSNDQGETLVLKPGKEYKELHRNRVNEGSGGNIFFAGKRAYFRGGEVLYCVGEK